MAALGETIRQGLPDTLVVLDDENGCHPSTIPKMPSTERTPLVISRSLNQALSTQTRFHGIMVM